MRIEKPVFFYHFNTSFNSLVRLKSPIGIANVCIPLHIRSKNVPFWNLSVRQTVNWVQKKNWVWFSFFPKGCQIQLEWYYETFFEWEPFISIVFTFLFPIVFWSKKIKLKCLKENMGSYSSLWVSRLASSSSHRKPLSSRLTSTPLGNTLWLSLALLCSMMLVHTRQLFTYWK